MKILYLMVGPPACGKSTYCKEHMTDKTVWVSRDKIRFSLLKEGDEYFSKEKQVWRDYVAALQEAIDNPEIETIYADATHLNEVSRSRILRSLRIDRSKCNVGVIVFTTNYHTCSSRNAEREGLAHVPNGVVWDMFYAKTNPSDDKKFQYDDFIYVDTSDDDPTWNEIDEFFSEE